MKALIERNGTKIQIEYDDEKGIGLSLDEMLEIYGDVLRALGFVYDGYVTIYNPEEDKENQDGENV